MTHRQSGAALLMLGSSLLAGTWAFLRPLPIPLYDGIILPEQPYRYLKPPPGAPSGTAPTSARVRVSTGEEESLSEFVYTGEQPPQASLILDPAGLSIPPGITHVTFLIRPVLPPAAPSSGSLEGNVYWFGAATDSGSPLAIRKGAKATVSLRATGERGTPVVEQLIHGGWVRRTASRRLGLDIFSTTVPTLGYFALILPGRSPPQASGPRAPSYISFLVIGSVVVVLLAFSLLAVQLSRSDRTDRGPSSA